MSPTLYTMIHRSKEEPAAPFASATLASFFPRSTKVSKAKPKFKVKAGPLIGIVIACVLVLVVLAVLMFCYIRFRRRRRALPPPLADNATSPSTTENKNSTGTPDSPSLFQTFSHPLFPIDQLSLSSPHYLHFNESKTTEFVSSQASAMVAPTPPQAPATTPLAPIPPPLWHPSNAYDARPNPTIGGFALAPNFPAPSIPYNAPQPQSQPAPHFAPDPVVDGSSAPAPAPRAAAALDAGPVPMPTPVAPVAPGLLPNPLGANQALVFDLKQRPLPEPPRQPVPAGAGQWI